MAVFHVISSVISRCCIVLISDHFGWYWIASPCEEGKPRLFWDLCALTRHRRSNGDGWTWSLDSRGFEYVCKPYLCNSTTLMLKYIKYPKDKTWTYTIHYDTKQGSSGVVSCQEVIVWLHWVGIIHHSSTSSIIMIWESRKDRRDRKVGQRVSMTLGHRSSRAMVPCLDVSQLKVPSYSCSGSCVSGTVTCPIGLSAYRMLSAAVSKTMCCLMLCQSHHGRWLISTRIVSGNTCACDVDVWQSDSSGARNRVPGRSQGGPREVLGRFVRFFSLH